MRRPMIAVTAAFAVRSLCASGSLAKSKSNIPKARLDKGVYTSPAGEFTLSLRGLTFPNP